MYPISGSNIWFQLIAYPAVFYYLVSPLDLATMLNGTGYCNRIFYLLRWHETHSTVSV